MKKLLKRIIVLLVITGICSAAGWVVYDKTKTGQDVDEEMSLYTVTEGPLIISITEPGTIKAREVEVIKSELEGRSTVLWVIDEASQVKKGDKLIELDSSNLNDSKIKQEITVQTANTAFIVSRENLEVTKNKAKSDIEQAELDLKFAKMDLKQYNEGEYPNLLKDNEAKILIAEEEVKRTEDKYEWSKKLAEKKYISATELKSDELAWRKADVELQLKRNQLALLENYTKKRTVEELESNVKQSEMALERTRRKASADVIQAQAELNSSKAKKEREQSLLDKIEEQLSKSVIYSPVDGMVIYATSTKFSWRSNDEPLDEGQEVHEREELFYLPTDNLIKVEANIHEANLDKIKIGSKASIKVDAIPGVIFSGNVENIGVMPDPMAAFINPNLKLYATDIFVDEESTEGYNTKLRTGMGCQVEIIADKYEKCIYVPIQAVISVEGQSTVYVYKNGKTTRRIVEIGLDNNRMVRIINGLKAGEQVLMTPPLADAEVKKSSLNKKFNRQSEEGKSSKKQQGGFPGKSPAGPGGKNRQQKSEKGGMGQTRPESQ